MKEQENITERNMDRKLSDVVFLGLCLILPALIMAFVWKELGISYGGKVTPFVYDMKEQFLAFFASLRYVAKGQNSLLYSWGEALGGNNLGMIAYYVASPLSWITTFYELSELPDAIYLLTLLKMGLCGLCFGIYTRYGLLKQKCGVVNLVLSCCYALMSYNVLYSSFLMWMDGLIFLPLILLGIEKIIEGKKGILYFTSILMLFVCNYYISYMVGIFAAVYMVCRTMMVACKEKWKDALQLLLRFGIVTLLAIAVASPILLVALKSISNGKVMLTEADSEYRLLGAYNFGFAELLAKFLPSQYDGMDNSSLPSVYCGALTVGLAICYFLQKKTNVREKICWLVVLMVPMLGFLIPQADYVWHVFQYPNSFPYRYAFLVPTVLVILANLCWQRMHFRKTNLTNLLIVTGTIYAFLELFLNGSAIVNGLHREYIYPLREEYTFFVEQHESLVDKVKQEDGFFRTEFVNDYLVDNSAHFFGVNGCSSFSSTFNGKVNWFLQAMGGEEYSIFTTSKDLTPLGDSLLGIRYRITKDVSIPGYECDLDAEGAKEGMFLHENENALSIGYLVDSETELRAELLGENPYENQNKVLEAFGVEDCEVFHKIAYRVEQKNGDWYLEFEAPSEENIYFYINGKKNWVSKNEETGNIEVLPRRVNILLNEEAREVAALTNCDLGTYKTGETLHIKVSGDALEVEDFYLYEMDGKVYENAIKQLKSGQMKVTSYKGGNVVGEIEAVNSGQVLFTTIPADGGHTVKVDGQENAYMEAFGTFVAIPLEQGSHCVEIEYTPPGLNVGIVLSVLGILMAILYFMNKKMNFIYRKGCKKC